MHEQIGGSEWSVTWGYLGAVVLQTAAFGTDPEASVDDDGLSDDVLRQAQQDAGGLCEALASESDRILEVGRDAVELRAGLGQLVGGGQRVGQVRGVLGRHVGHCSVLRAQRKALQLRSLLLEVAFLARGTPRVSLAKLAPTALRILRPQPSSHHLCRRAPAPPTAAMPATNVIGDSGRGSALGIWRTGAGGYAGGPQKSL